MEFQNWQKEFDVTKWVDSMAIGTDTCGSYEFCEKCNKDEDFPCARAYNRYKKRPIRIAVLKANSNV